MRATSMTVNALGFVLMFALTGVVWVAVDAWPWHDRIDWRPIAILGIGLALGGGLTVWVSLARPDASLHRTNGLGPEWVCPMYARSSQACVHRTPGDPRLP